MRRALAVGLVVALGCGFLGLFVVLRRIVFLGIALAEVSSTGVALALLMGFNPMVGSLALMLLGVGLFSVRWSPRKVAQESFIGIGWAVASAAGILLVAKSATGESHMLDLIYGNILTVTTGDIWRTGVVLGGVVLLHLLFAKEFLFVSFDPDTVAAMGYRARLWDLLLYATLGLTISFSIQAVGVLMTFSALVLPPVTALLLARRMRTAAAVSMLVGAIPLPVGLYLSFVWDLPTSATVVAVSFLLLLAAGGTSLLVRRAV
jgi:zinc transport system permease protein